MWPTSRPVSTVLSCLLIAIVFFENLPRSDISCYGHSHLPTSSRERIFSFATIATLRLRHRIFAIQLRGRQARGLFETAKGNP
jgi:hypothetical protein